MKRQFPKRGKQNPARTERDEIRVYLTKYEAKDPERIEGFTVCGKTYLFCETRIG